MCRIDERNSWIEAERLSPQDWEHLKRRIIGRAQDARSQAFRDLPSWIQAASHAALQAAGLLAVRALEGIARRWRAYRLWRERSAAIRALGALDDRMLKDIGLGRSEIASAIVDPERLAARAVAGARRPQRSARADVRGWPKHLSKPGASPLIDKTAA